MTDAISIRAFRIFRKEKEEDSSFGYSVDGVPAAEGPFDASNFAAALKDEAQRIVRNDDGISGDQVNIDFIV